MEKLIEQTLQEDKFDLLQRSDLSNQVKEKITYERQRSKSISSTTDIQNIVQPFKNIYLEI